MEYFLAGTLLFGQTAAVYDFNRVSGALQWWLTSWGLSLTCYFDDFPQLEPEGLAGEAWAFLKKAVDWLGWPVAIEAKKDKAPAEMFDVLGVTVDLSRLEEGLLIVKPKEGRIEDIFGMVEDAMGEVGLAPPEAAVLAGKLGFLMGSVAGRVSAIAMNSIRRRAASRHGRADMAEDLWKALEWLKDNLPRLEPRAIEVLMMRRPALLLTDGACECDGTFVGGLAKVDGKAEHSGRRFQMQ